jgi:hypothetical protein
MIASLVGKEYNVLQSVLYGIGLAGEDKVRYER